VPPAQPPAPGRLRPSRDPPLPQAFGAVSDVHVRPGASGKAVHATLTLRGDDGVEGALTAEHAVGEGRLFVKVDDGGRQKAHVRKGLEDRQDGSGVAPWALVSSPRATPLPPPRPLSLGRPRASMARPGGLELEGHGGGGRREPTRLPITQVQP